MLSKLKFRGSHEEPDCQDDDCIYLFRSSLSQLDPFTKAELGRRVDYYVSTQLVPYWALPGAKEYERYYWALFSDIDLPALSL